MQTFRNGELVWCVEPIWGKEGISVVGLVAGVGCHSPNKVRKASMCVEHPV